MSTNEAAEETHASGRADAVAYMFRPSLMGAPQEFAVEQDALVWSIGRHSGRIPYRSIRRIRLSYRPVTLQMHRFLMEVWSDAAPKLSIASTSWRTLVEQERLDRPYREFVRALHRRLVEAGARPMLRAGSSPLVYWPGVAVFGGLGLALPTMMIRTGASGDALWGAIIVALVVGLFLWQLGNFFWRNRPITYSAEAVPAAVLPRG
jgi:hypothetical protein